MKKVTKNILVILFIVVFVGALAFATYKLFIEKTDEEKTEIIKAEEDQKAQKKEATIPVKISTVEQGDLPLRLKISGIADVWEKAVIKSEVSGKVEKIYVSIGDWVKKGQVLAKIEDTELKLEVDRQKANKLKTLSNYLVKDTTVAYKNQELTAEQKKELADSKARYTQAVKDFEHGKISEKRYEVIRDEHERLLVLYGAMRDEILKATENLTDSIIALKKAEIDLKRSTIKSPFQGKISELKISTGERINAGTDMFKVVNLKSVYLIGGSLESELQKLKKGTRVRIKFDAYPEQFFWGEIEAINPEVGKDKIVNFYVKVDNKDNLIMPGMSCEMDVEYKVFHDVIRVPVNAVQNRSDRYLVFIVRDKIALWAYVDVGAKNDEFWQIKEFQDSKYKVGDQVVVEGHLTLAHQSRVRIIK